MTPKNAKIMQHLEPGTKAKNNATFGAWHQS
jgi:hypothetical protein